MEHYSSFFQHKDHTRLCTDGPEPREFPVPDHSTPPHVNSSAVSLSRRRLRPNINICRDREAKRLFPRIAPSLLQLPTFPTERQSLLAQRLNAPRNISFGGLQVTTYYSFSESTATWRQIQHSDTQLMNRNSFSGQEDPCSSSSQGFKGSVKCDSAYSHGRVGYQSSCFPHVRALTNEARSLR